MSNPLTSPVETLRRASIKQPLAREIGGDPVQIFPPIKGTVTKTALTSATTSALALASGTSLVRFFVPQATSLIGVYIRWNTSGTVGDLTGASNAHHFIPTGIPVDLPKPPADADTHLLMMPDGANATMVTVEI